MRVTESQNLDVDSKNEQKITNRETVIFVYDAMGKLAAEYSTATPTSNPTTNYTATDPLGL
jgi:3-deoxy-D-manno-octulosonic-acid transferase